MFISEKNKWRSVGLLFSVCVVLGPAIRFSFASDKAYFLQATHHTSCEDELQPKLSQDQFKLKIFNKLQVVPELVPDILKLLSDPNIPYAAKSILRTVLTHKKVHIKAMKPLMGNTESGARLYAQAFYAYENIAFDDKNKSEFDEQADFNSLLDRGQYVILIPKLGYAPYAQIFFLCHEIAHIFLAMHLDRHAYDLLQVFPRQWFHLSPDQKQIRMNDDFEKYIHELFAYEFEHWLMATSVLVPFGYSSFHPTVNYYDPGFHLWLNRSVQALQNTNLFLEFTTYNNSSIVQSLYHHFAVAKKNKKRLVPKQLVSR